MSANSFVQQIKSRISFIRARARIASAVGALAIVSVVAACSGGGSTPPAPTLALSVQSALGTGSGTVAGSGITCEIVGSFQSGTCIKNFAQGTDIALAANPATGSVFLGWGGACATSGTGTCLFKMLGTSNVTANFAPITFALTVASGGGTGNGSVAGNGVACVFAGATTSGTCTGSYAPSTVVTLTATAAVGGHVFGGWGGDCTGTGATCVTTMSQTRSVTATYRVPTSLTVTSGGGDGNGTVTGVGIACTITAATQGGTCTSPFPDTSTVVLTATPAAGSHTFAGWGGACAGTAATCSVPMNLVRAVTARFNAPVIQFALTVASGGGSGNGVVTTIPASGNLNCTITAGAAAGTCTANLLQNTDVTLTAAAAPGGHGFAGWGGACAGVATTCTVNMSQARSVTASFTAPASAFTLTVASSGGTGNGTIGGGGIACNITAATQNGTCSALLATGTVVQLTATGTGGATFNGWGGACAGTGACSVTMSQARSVTASFTAPTLFAIAVSRSGGTGSGKVTATGIDCTIDAVAATGTCNATALAGSVLTLTAAPSAGGHTFGGWGGDCAGLTLTCNVTMSQARAVSASFVAPPIITIGASASGNGTGTVKMNNGPACNVTLATAPPYAARVDGNCAVSFAVGATVTLQATVDPDGNTFEGWSGGGCAGTTNPCVITVSGNATITPKFNAPSLATVQTQVFNVYCQGCHAVVLMNNATNSFNNLVNRDNVYKPPLAGYTQYTFANNYPKRIQPYAAAFSYVIFEMQKHPSAYPMPTNATTVPNSLINVVKNWINGGALANQP